MSKQDGSAAGVETTGAWDILEEDCVRRRAVPVQASGIPPQVRVGRIILGPMEFAWGQVSDPSKTRQLGSRGAVRNTSKLLEALRMPCQKVVTKFVDIWDYGFPDTKKINAK